MVELALLTAFVILILLPWFGGLFLIVINTHYVRDIIIYQSDRLKNSQERNDRLRQENDQLTDQVRKQEQTLQAILIENATISARYSQLEDELTALRGNAGTRADAG